MRAERSWYYALLAGSFLMILAYGVASRAGEPHAVRHAWLEGAPFFLGVGALLGLALHGWRGPKDALGKVICAATVGALGTHFLLALAAPAGPGEPAMARAYAGLLTAGWLALPLLVLFLEDARPAPRVADVALGLLAGIALLLAAALVWAAWTAPAPLRMGVAVSWSSFVLAGGWAVLKLLRARARFPRASSARGADVTPPELLDAERATTDG